METNKNKLIENNKEIIPIELKTESRILIEEDFEIRALPDSRNVEGRAIVFNKESALLHENEVLFYERILPEAIKGVIDKSDVLCLLNHNMERGVLARSSRGKGSLKLTPEERGVNYSFTAPKTGLGDELLEGLARGDIKGSSFSFRVAQDGQRWERRADGTILRTISKFHVLEDVSPCYKPAYQDTEVAIRSLDKFKELEMPIVVPEIKVEPEIKLVIEEPIIKPIIREEPEVKETVVEQRNINLKHTKMTITELKDLRATALEENEKIYVAKDAEKRTMTDKEEATTALNNQRVKEYDLQIETESRKVGAGVFAGAGLPYIQMGRDKEPFSLIKSIRSEVDHKPLSEATMQVSSIGRQQYRSETMQNPIGSIVLPNFAPPVIGRKEMRADILAQTATAGQEIVAEDKKSIIPPLVNKLVFAQAGVTYMPGLVGNVSIPTYAGTTVAWKDEVETAADGGGAFSEVEFAPKKLTALIDVSKTFLAQDGVGAERLLLENISGACARMLEATILGNATVSSKFPSGIGYKLNAANGGGVAELTGATITYAALVGLETTVDTGNAAQGNLAYITNGTARGLLKVIDIGTANDTGEFIMMDNMMNGYPVLVTNSIGSTAGAGGTGNAVFFGNWADLVIAQWGGFDITVDPYTQAATNQVRIVINCYFDALGLRGLTGAGATLDEYAVSFAALSVV